MLSQLTFNVLSTRHIVDWVSLVVGVIGFVGNFASIYILSLPSIGRWRQNYGGWNYNGDFDGDDDNGGDTGD